MIAFGVWTLVLAGLLAGYAYAGYPLVLKLISMVRAAPGLRQDPPEEWPFVSITVPMYNEEGQAAGLVESLLALDYPAERRQILIVSDGSTDRTNEIVESYAGRGVELIAQRERVGKTACENAVAAHLRGEIIVNTDASIRIAPEALKRMVAPFQDEAVGLTSGRDVSVGGVEEGGNLGESGYVGYEMWVRDLETTVSTIVGASGCFYATRRDLHLIPVPASLSRDFSAALKCADAGYRAVSVRDAICLVPRATSIRSEYRRKVRTMTRGIETLVYWRRLLNPTRYGLVSWMLFSHKVCRWALPWVLLLAGMGIALLAWEHAWAGGLLAVGLVGLAVGLFAWIVGDRVSLPRAAQIVGFGVMGTLAAMHALARALAGSRDQIWEPTRRERFTVAE